MNAPDRTGPMIELFTDSGSYGQPEGFPWAICPKNVRFRTPDITIGTTLRIVLSLPDRFCPIDFNKDYQNWASGWAYMLEHTGKPIVFTPTGLTQYSTAFGSLPTTANMHCVDKRMIPDRKYQYRISTPSANELLFAISDMDDVPLLSFTHSTTGSFTNPPVIYLGWPWPAVLASEIASWTPDDFLTHIDGVDPYMIMVHSVDLL